MRVGLDVVEVLETNRTFMNLSPYGEPQLGRRGLYRSSGGAVESPDDERALLWVLNLSDGDASLLDIAARSGLPYAVILRAAERLEQAGLLAAGRGSIIGPRPISLRDDPLLRRRPLDPERGVVPAHAAGRLRDVLVRHLVGDLGVVDERLVALGEPLRDVQQPAVLRAELDAEPLRVGRRVGPQVDDRHASGAASASHELHLAMRRLLEVQSAERVALGAEDRAGLNEASHQPVVGELLLAIRAGKVAAFVAATLDVDDEGVLAAASA